MLTPGEVGVLNPLIRLDDVLAGAFCPLDGHATPEAVVQGYASGARAHGATLLTDCEVDAIEVEDGEIRAVVDITRARRHRHRRVRGGRVVPVARRAGRRRARRHAAAPAGARDRGRPRPPRDAAR